MKKKKYILIIVMLLFIIVPSVLVYIKYDDIYKGVENRRSKIDVTAYVETELFHNGYVLKGELAKKENPSISNEELFLDLQQLEDEVSQEAVIESFNHNISSWKQHLLEYSDIYYYVKDTKTNQELTNTEYSLDTLIDNTSDDYFWYVVLKYDESGNVTMLHDTTEDYTLPEILDTDRMFFPEEYLYSGNEILKNPSDMIVVYAMDDVITKGEIGYVIQSHDIENYLLATLPYLVMGLAGILLFTLFMPYQDLYEIKVFKVFTNIKFGFLMILYSGIFALLITGMPYIMCYTISGEFLEGMRRIGFEFFNEGIIRLVNILGWMLFFMASLLCIYAVKTIFVKGIKRYAKENTIIGWMFMRIQELWHFILNFDLNDNVNKVVLKVILLNLGIMSVICCFFVLGIVFAIIYSGILYYILKNKFDEIQHDFRVLLNATRRLSNGEFNTDIQEDVGLFNPLKEEFSHIQEGFKKAVDEEVRSQKMKTELISNVSHDLKTPLTSIITYIDLLKKEDTSEEEKVEYIEILERNANRLKKLIEDLFEVSKASSGDVKLNYQDIDIIALLKQVQFECEDAITSQNLDLRFQCEEDKVICHLDSEKTYRIFENLILNACKYSLEKTRFYITVSHQVDRVDVVFRNIAADEMLFDASEIVERFVQGDKSRTRGGSGLGLAIAKSFTEIQGGTFKVEIDGDLFKVIVSFACKR